MASVSITQYLTCILGFLLSLIILILILKCVWFFFLKISPVRAYFLISFLSFRIQACAKFIFCSRERDGNVFRCRWERWHGVCRSQVECNAWCQNCPLKKRIVGRWGGMGYREKRGTNGNRSALINIQTESHSYVSVCRWCYYM